MSDECLIKLGIRIYSGTYQAANSCSFSGKRTVSYQFRVPCIKTFFVEQSLNMSCLMGQTLFYFYSSFIETIVIPVNIEDPSDLGQRRFRER